LFDAFSQRESILLHITNHKTLEKQPQSLQFISIHYSHLSKHPNASWTLRSNESQADLNTIICPHLKVATVFVVGQPIVKDRSEASATSLTSSVQQAVSHKSLSFTRCFSL